MFGRPIILAGYLCAECPVSNSHIRSAGYSFPYRGTLQNPPPGTAGRQKCRQSQLDFKDDLYPESNVATTFPEIKNKKKMEIDFKLNILQYNLIFFTWSKLKNISFRDPCNKNIHVVPFLAVIQTRSLYITTTQHPKWCQYAQPQ